ncbi:MAG TPA: YbbR-like domain-containing protein [Desulfobulbaceae bacterium]|nr:YbbR-like domain-containing protein [Desulfobulbaceae bacterium]
MMKFKLFHNKPKNWILKIVSLCLAVMLWYFVVGEDQVDMNIQVPLEIINLPANLTIANNFKKNIDVSVRGPRSVILDLRNRNITRPVDLSSAQPGTVVIKNDEQSIPLPKGIVVQRLQPTNITLLLDQLTQKNFPIKTVIEGTTAQGYELGKVTIDPDHLIISGPQAVLDNEQSLNTYAISLNGLDRSTTLQVHLNLKPEFFDLIGETVVTAKVEVVEKLDERTVEKVPVVPLEPQAQVKISPQTVSVRAAIPHTLIKNNADLAALFQATVMTETVSAPSEVPVVVIGQTVQGHAPIKVISVTPPAVLVAPNEEKAPAEK